MLVFDSGALIALLEGETGAAEVKRLLADPGPRFIHALNFIEVFYHMSRGTDVLAARATLERFALGGLVERPDLDPLFREDVAQLKADWRRVTAAVWRSPGG